jgi:hypothetical protein
MGMQSMIRIDGTPFRLMGGEAPGNVPPMPQLGFANVTATRTQYQFAGSVPTSCELCTPGCIATFANGVQLEAKLSSPTAMLLYTAGAAALNETFMWTRPATSRSDCLGKWVDTGNNEAIVSKGGITGQPVSSVWYPAQCAASNASDVVSVTLSFVTPSRADNLTSIRPITYLSWVVRSDTAHSIQLYFDIDAEFATNSNSEMVQWGRMNGSGWGAMRIGSVAQKPFTIVGNSNHINWGHVYLATNAAATTTTSLSAAPSMRAAWSSSSSSGGVLPTADDQRQPRAVDDDWIVAAVSFDCGVVGGVAGGIGGRQCEQSAVVAYDDTVAIEYDHTPLVGWWRRGLLEGDAGMAQLLSNALSHQEEELTASEAFDAKLHAALEAVGGVAYAQVQCYIHYNCTHYVLYSLHTALTMHCTHYALYSLCTVLTMHCTHYAPYSLCTVPTMHYTHAQVGALSYRQTLGANILVVLPDGKPGHFSRECGSGDDILTMHCTHYALCSLCTALTMHYTQVMTS